VSEASSRNLSVDAAATSTMDSDGVCAVLRAASCYRAAEQVDSVIKQHRLMQQYRGLSVVIGGDEAEGWQQWGEKPPPFTAAAQGLEERSKFMNMALGDAIFYIAPKQPVVGSAVPIAPAGAAVPAGDTGSASVNSPVVGVGVATIDG